MPGFQALQHRQVLPEGFELAAYMARAIDHAHTEFRGDRPAPAAHEELHAELGFELVNMARHVRLHRVQPIGRGREGTLFGHGEERFELTNIQRFPPGPIVRL